MTYPTKFSPNLNLFFKELPFPERIRKIADLGFQKFEFWGWWDEDVAAIAKSSRENAVEVAAFCTKFVSLVDDTRRTGYLTGLEQTIEVAKTLNCQTLISQVGDEMKGVPRAIQRASLVAGLKEAAPVVEQAGITLTIEPLNLSIDHAGYFLSRSDEAFEIVREVGSPHIKVLFDIYHQQVTEGNVINSIRSGSSLIGHYHIADNPGRGEIGSGELNYPNIVRAIIETGYDGAIGVELFPKQGNDEHALKGILDIL